MQYQSLKVAILEKLEKELSEKLYYHSVSHTRDVLSACEASAKRESLSNEEETLLLSAAVLHDAGFLYTSKDHEAEGVRIAKKILPTYDYSSEQIERVSNMILATKIPQNPSNILESLICDADLDYLGRDDFYAIGSTLFAELKAQSILDNEKDWDALQIKFLSSHSFHTDWSIQEREPVKQKYLEELKAKWK